jgi:hypothetical protein
MEYEASFSYSKQPVVGLYLQPDTPNQKSFLKIHFNIVLSSDNYGMTMCKGYINF